MELLAENANSSEAPFVITLYIAVSLWADIGETVCIVWYAIQTNFSDLRCYRQNPISYAIAILVANRFPSELTHVILTIFRIAYNATRLFLAEISPPAQDYNNHVPFAKGFRDDVVTTSTDTLFDIIHKIEKLFHSMN